MKTIILFFITILLVPSRSLGDNFDPLVDPHCPGRTFNVIDFILPGRNYFLETGSTFSYEISDPSVHSFRLSEMIPPTGMPGDIYRRLRAMLPPNPDYVGSGPTRAARAADIFFGFLGQTAETSISRSVGGDPSLFIGYSSNSTYTPSGIKQKVKESLNLAGTPDLGSNYLREFLAVKRAVSPKAEKRFGPFQGLLYDSQGRIRGIKFKNKLFNKSPDSRGYSTDEGEASLTIFDDLGV